MLDQEKNYSSKMRFFGRIHGGVVGVGPLIVFGGNVVVMYGTWYGMGMFWGYYGGLALVVMRWVGVLVHETNTSSKACRSLIHYQPPPPVPNRNRVK